MTSLINFKIDQQIKNQLEKQASLKHMTLSEYLREVVTEKISPQNKKSNLFANLAGILSAQEAKDFDKQIADRRKNRNWKNIGKN